MPGTTMPTEPTLTEEECREFANLDGWQQDDCPGSEQLAPCWHDLIAMCRAAFALGAKKEADWWRAAVQKWADVAFGRATVTALLQGASGTPSMLVGTIVREATERRRKLDAEIAEQAPTCDKPDEPILRRTRKGTRWHLTDERQTYDGRLTSWCGKKLMKAGLLYHVIPKNAICAACLRESQRER